MNKILPCASSLLLLLLAMSSPMSFGQDESSVCNGLLRHGVYDKYREVRSDAKTSEIRAHICEAYQKLQQDKTAGHVEGHYGLAGGEGSYSRDQLESIGQFMCADNFNASSASSALTVIQDKISDSAMDAYRECIAQNSSGLKTKTVFREEDQAQVTIELRYVAPVGAPPQTTVNTIVLSPADSFTCRGTLWDVQKKANGVGTNTVAMSCDRKVEKTPVSVAGQKIFAPPATITVMTTSGTLTRSMSAISAGPPPTPLELPVGTIVAFSGTMEEASGQKQFGWWVCNGSSVEDPLADPRYKNSKTPDLSNRFLRGSVKAGDVGGAASFDIPSQNIRSHTNGIWGDPRFNSDPFTHMQGPHSFTTDAAIYSDGTWTGVTVPTVPEFYSVIYLVKVK